MARKREIILLPGNAEVRLIRAETRARLLEAIAKARRWLEELISCKVSGTDVAKSIRIAGSG